MKRKVNNASTSDLLRYFKTLWPKKCLDKCTSVEDAIDALRALDEDIYIPEGLDETCVVTLDRLPVRGSVWTLSPSKTLAKMALEIADEDGRGYLLLCDENLHGIDSVMLCAVSINENNFDAQEDIAYIIKTWMRQGAPNIMIGSYADKRHGGVVSIVAAQLKSLIKC